MTTPANGEQTPVNTTGSASFADLGGREALMQAFGETPNPTPVQQPDPVSSDVSGQGASGEQGQTGEQEPKPDAQQQAQTTQQTQQPAYDPRAIEATVNQTVQQRLDALRQQNEYEQFQRELNALPPEEYKRVTQSLQQQTYSAQKIRQDVGAEVTRALIADVVTGVPELTKVTPEQAAELDPRKFDTPGKMTARYIDFVAEQRAEKIAEKRTKEAVEAFKADYIAKQAKKYPSQPSMQNGVPAGGSIDIEKATGRQLLEAAFANG